jgi:hypothetical protein
MSKIPNYAVKHCLQICVLEKCGLLFVLQQLHQQIQLRTEGRGNGERGSGGGSPLVRCSAQFVNEWNPVFVLGFYGCIFYGTGNSAQLCQNFGISGKGTGFELPTPPPQYAAATVLV